MTDNITFTFEEERNNMISFSLLIHKQDEIDLAVFRKETNTDLYYIKNAFALETWKRGTLKMLSLQSLLVRNGTSSSGNNICINFPRNVVKRIFKQVRTETNVETQQPTTQLKKTLLSTNSFNLLFLMRAKRENTSWRKLKKSLKA